MTTSDNHLTEDERAEIETRRAHIRAEQREIDKIMARARQRARRARQAEH